MICFDKKTLRILRYIRRHKKNGVTWAKLRKKFGEDDANTFLLESLSKELYTCSKDASGSWVSFDKDFFAGSHDYRSFCTPKGNEVVEKRYFDFWKFAIPLLISLAALTISAITLLLRLQEQAPPP